MNKYYIIEPIGKGSFGTIYKGQNKETKEYVAIKYAKTNEYNNIIFESKLYQYINRMKAKGFPKLKWYGTQTIDNVLYNYMVLELLGSPLTTLIGSISFENALNIGIQLIERVKTLHSLNLVHRDIKPDNCLFGLPKSGKENTLYLIDLGMAKKYINDDTNMHIDKPQTNRIHGRHIGTQKYISLNEERCILEPTRRDDIESCLYIIMELIYGKLPWDTNDIHKRYDIKKHIVTIMTKGFLVDLLVYVRSLNFEDEPDYEYIVSTLQNQIPIKLS